MSWAIRTLDELRVTEPHSHHDGNDLVVHVNHEEVMLLHFAGAVVKSSGCRNLERGTQRYEFEGKIYFWLAGFGSGDWDDEYPVSDVVCSRLREVVEISRRLG